MSKLIMGHVEAVFIHLLDSDHKWSTSENDRVKTKSDKQYID